VRKRVVRLIARLDLTKSVELYDFISESEKAKLLEASVFFLFPSYEEGWSLSVMEAAAHGLVPILYSLSAYDYLGDGAVRVPVGDTDAMANAIVDLAGRADRVATMTEDARKAVRAFDRKSIAGDQANLFREWAKIHQARHGRAQNPLDVNDFRKG
jgi:glycosyltransferase involved in cell wall biosynthesis